MIVVESITTKFGTARIDSNGYWRISSRKEGNRDKLLHRLIYENYYNCTLYSNEMVHHKDGNKLNNRIDNLEVMSRAKHMSHHRKGKNSPKYWVGKKFSNEHKQKLSEAHKGENNNRCRWNEIDIAGGLELLHWYKYTLKLSQNKVAKLHNMSDKVIMNYLKNKDLNWGRL